MIMRLALALPADSLDYILYLDNLFTSIPLAKALKEASIGVTGTTRKNTKGTPQWLLTLKEKNKELVWNSALGEVVEGVLIFLWQDNNAVIGKLSPERPPQSPLYTCRVPPLLSYDKLTGALPLVISTVHSIHLPEDVVERLRRRPRVSSTNARNVGEVFGVAFRLKLFIPLAIDLYNHHMNGADVANQRRSHLTTQRKHNMRTWRPLFYWLLDVTLTNCFILWRLQVRRKDSKLTWDPVEFNRGLGSALLVHDPTNNNLRGSSSTSVQASTNSSTQATRVTLKAIAPNRCRGVLPGIPSRVEAVTDLKSVLLARGHDMCREGSGRGECVGCKIDGKASRSGRPTNAEYASTVGTKCKQCNVYLCRKGKCWERYHNSKKY
jgi:hypothetical protein